MALRGILPEDYTNKGIRTKSNPLGLQVSEAQRAFDELSLDVIIPAVNKIVEEQNLINETIQPKEEGKVLSSNDFTNKYKQAIDNLPETLETKVDKEEGKGLSTNDFTDEDKNAISNMVTVSEVLVKGNDDEFIPSKPYEPATKKYVDENLISGGVPSSRKINGYALSSDVNLKASDVGAVSTNTFNTTVEGINTTVSGIGGRVTTLETTINSLVNGEAVQY